jgi:catechol 2,3-dioxygenase-like lactoylglutathione lyase family enzyme
MRRTKTTRATQNQSLDEIVKNAPPIWCRAVLILWVLGASIALGQQSTALISAVDSVNMTVSDMDSAVDFYSRVLQFRKVSDVEVTGENYEHLEGVFGVRMHVVRMRLGDEYIQLTEYLAPKGRPLPLGWRSNDRSFQHIAVIVADMDKAYAWLRQNKVEHASSGPQRLPDWNKSAAGIRAFYFKDPDGHPLEILQFPAGKGAEEWHRPSTNLFLGIDHTAIVVGDTETSLAFYRDLLGMRVAGESENYGTEQEHLNNVFGARLRITSLRSATGPGIELLEYVAPRDGQLFPADEHANDILHRQTEVTTADAEAAAQKLVSAHIKFVSSGVVTESHGQLGFHKAFLVRDPDGHALLLEEK